MARTYDDMLDLETTRTLPRDEAETPVFAGAGTAAEAGPEDPAQSIGSKHAMARSVIIAFAAASAAVTTIPLPFKDAVMLSPIELAEVNALARIYGIPQEENTRKILDAIMELGVISMAARGAIEVLDRTPRLRVTAKLRSALIAATIVAGVGVATLYAFEQVYLGKRSLSDLGIARKVQQSETWQELSAAISDALGRIMSDAALDGLKVSLSEMLKAVVPVA